MGQTNGASTNGKDTDRPLTSIIQAEEQIIEEAEPKYDPNTGEKLEWKSNHNKSDDDGGNGDETQEQSSSSEKEDQSNLQQQLAELREQVATMSKQMMPDMDKASEKSDEVMSELEQQLHDLREQVSSMAKSAMPGQSKDADAKNSDSSDTSEDENDFYDEIVQKLMEIASDVKTAVGIKEVPEKVANARDKVKSQVMSMVPDKDDLNDIKDEYLAPAVEAALPTGLGKIGKTTVEQVSTKSLVKYGIPIAVAIMAVQYWSEQQEAKQG